MGNLQIVTLDGVEHWQAQTMWHTPNGTWLRQAEGPDDGDGFVVVIDDADLIGRLDASARGGSAQGEA